MSTELTENEEKDNITNNEPEELNNENNQQPNNISNPQENVINNEDQSINQDNHMPEEDKKENINETTNIIKNDAYYKGLIEAILYIETEPVSHKKLSELLNLETKKIKELLGDLNKEYIERQSGLQINEIANEIRISTNVLYGEFLKNYYNTQHKSKFSKSSLETLAIIAYKQPITRSEIEDIRGVSSDNAVRDLLEKKLIKIVGRKKVPGNPILYGSTKEFLAFFGLKNINDLPTLKEIKELKFE